MKKENNIPEYKINCYLAKFDGYTDKEILCSLELYKIVEMMNSKKFTKRYVEFTKNIFYF